MLYIYSVFFVFPGKQMEGETVKLFRITTQFWGKDLEKTAFLGYVVADSPEQVADHIDQKHKDGYWFGDPDVDDPDEKEYKDEKRKDYVEQKGDFHTEYAGEFYDQKFGWEELGEVSEEQVAMLRSLGIVEDLKIEDKE